MEAANEEGKQMSRDMTLVMVSMPKFTVELVKELAHKCGVSEDAVYTEAANAYIIMASAEDRHIMFTKSSYLLRSGRPAKVEEVLRLVDRGLRENKADMVKRLKKAGES